MQILDCVPVLYNSSNSPNSFRVYRCSRWEMPLLQMIYIYYSVNSPKHTQQNSKLKVNFQANTSQNWKFSPPHPQPWWYSPIAELHAEGHEFDSESLDTFQSNNMLKSCPLYAKSKSSLTAYLSLHVPMAGLLRLDDEWFPPSSENLAIRFLQCQFPPLNLTILQPWNVSPMAEVWHCKLQTALR